MNEKTVYKQLQSEGRMVISSMKLMGESTHDATAASALADFTAKLNSIPLPMRQCLTYDQGKESGYSGRS